MARPSNKVSQLTIEDVEKGIALARKLMDSYTAILDDPTGEHPSERQLDSVGKFLKDNGITLETVMMERNKKTAHSIDDDVVEGSSGIPLTRYQKVKMKKLQKETEKSMFPFTLDANGKSIPNPHYQDGASPGKGGHHEKRDAAVPCNDLV